MREYDKRPLQMPGSNAHRAQALALSGRRAAALAELDRVLELSKERYVAAYDIALIYAALGDTENTFLWLERAMEDRSTLISFLAQDPMFDTFHSDPRWAALDPADRDLSPGAAGWVDRRRHGRTDSTGASIFPPAAGVMRARRCSILSG